MGKVTNTKTTKTRQTKRGQTTKVSEISRDPRTSPYSGSSGRRQYKIDRMKLENDRLAGSRIKQVSSGASEIIRNTGASVAANVGTANMGRSGNQVVNAYNDIISGNPSPAEGTSEGKSGSTGSKNSTGTIPDG